MAYQENLLDKYYKGETSLEEEKELKKQMFENAPSEAEQDIFGFFEEEAQIPEGLEESLMTGIKEHQQKIKRIHRFRWYSVSSAAAVILLLLTIFIDARSERKAKLENSFFVMEQALYQVSESLQPEEQKEMMILWVDDDVELVIN